jgi:hypothetical protein
MATLTDPHLSLVRPVSPRTPGGRRRPRRSAKRVATAVGEGAMAIRLAFERTRPT